MSKKVYSRALGLWFEVEPDGTCNIDGVTYTPEEVRLLSNSKGNPEEVRGIHRVKKMFCGEIVSYGAVERVGHVQEFTRVGRSPRGRVWDSKQKKYIG